VTRRAEDSAPPARRAVPPRLAPLEGPFEPRLRDELHRIMGGLPGPALRLFRTLAHNPRVLRRVRRGGLLDPGSIAAREREIAILRTSARCGSDYEWGVHVRLFSAGVGLGPEAVRATALGAPDDPVWSEREACIVALADALHHRASVPEALWRRVERHFRPDQQVELVVLCGLYHAIAFATNAFGVEPEEGAPRLPVA